MKTKINYIDLAYQYLKNNDEYNHKAVIEETFNDIYNQILAEVPTTTLQKYEFYTKTYEVAVSKDSNSDRYYSTLPASIVPLPRPTDAITINSKKGYGMRFYPTTEREVRLYEDLESSQVDLLYGFYVQNGVVWYTNYTADLATAGVRMALTIQFKDYDDDDVVHVPENYNLLQLVIDTIEQKSIIDMQIPK